jgi:putative ABC transport system permease protein
MFAQLATLAVYNLLRARVRLLMTTSGVLIGTTAVILLIALTIGLQRSAEAQIGANQALTDIQVYPAWSPRPNTSLPQLTVEAVQRFARIPGVALVVPQVNLRAGGEIKVGKLVGFAQIIGIDPRLLPYLNLTAQEGSTALESGQVLVGSQAGANFFDPNNPEWQPMPVNLFTERPRMTLYGSTSAPRTVNLQVAGVLAPNPSFDYAILMPIRDVIAYNEWSSGERFDPKKFVYDMVTVRARDREVTMQVSEALREMGYGVGGIGDYLNAINSFFTTMRLMLGGIGAIALLVAAFGVANTMMMAILERTREIGLMKAVGATDSSILTIFLIEAGLVGFLGGLAGVGVSLLLQRVINEAVSVPPSADGSGMGPGMFLPVDLSNLQGGLIVIEPELIGFGLALATGVGLLAGLYPALRAARMNTVTALKTE